MRARPQQLLSIHSRVSSGQVGNSLIETAMMLAQPSISLWTIDTVQWTGPGNHPWRVGPTLPAHDLAAMMRMVMSPPDQNGGGVTSVLIGYLPKCDQVEIVAEMIDELKPEKVYLDPIIGDDGKLYLQEQTAKLIHELLLPRADFLFPNYTEATWLATGSPSGEMPDHEIADAIFSTTTRPQVLTITSCLKPEHGLIGQKQYRRNQPSAKESFHPLLQRKLYGTGDTYTALSVAEKMAAQVNTSSSPFEQAEEWMTKILERVGKIPLHQPANLRKILQSFQGERLLRESSFVNEEG